MRKEKKGEGELESLSEAERRALRGSKFAPLPVLQPSRTQPRLAHPGGPLATNKAAALAKFLERKLQEPDGLTSINPALLEMAVKNAKETVNASGTSNSGRIIRHVASFGDDSEDSGDSKGKIQDEGYFDGCKKFQDPGNGKGKNLSKAEGTKGKINKKKKKMKKVVAGMETTEAVKSKKKLKS